MNFSERIISDYRIMLGKPEIKKFISTQKCSRFAIALLTLCFFSCKKDCHEKGDAPTIELNGEKIIVLEIGKPYFEPGYKAYDSYNLNCKKGDGDITASVQVKQLWPINTSLADQYSISYEVIDSDDKTALISRDLYVILNTDTLIGAWDFSVKKISTGEVYPSYPSTISQSGDSSSMNFDYQNFILSNFGINGSLPNIKISVITACKNCFGGGPSLKTNFDIPLQMVDSQQVNIEQYDDLGKISGDGKKFSVEYVQNGTKFLLDATKKY